MNFTIALLAALIPVVTGSIWYNPKIAGNAWMKATGITPNRPTPGKMALIMGIALLFSFMLSLILHPMVIHQAHLHSIVMNTPGYGTEGSEVMNELNAFLSKYGTEFRTFKHGAFHGALVGIFFALPVFGMIAIFEERRFKYFLIHLIYWVLTLSLMGGVICQWS